MPSQYPTAADNNSSSRPSSHSAKSKFRLNFLTGRSSSSQSKPLTWSTFSLWNVTLNLHVNDIFGFGTLGNALLILATTHFSFLERQPPFIRWVIMIWELAIVTICVVYIGRMVDIVLVIVNIMNDGVRGVAEVLRVTTPTPKC
ncbi:925_t:CDS:2 [Paraglomus occultum]|uniref:925_t:CDS:1 n=1 Tax=Paraglomus occultum TaxID=144539 RepID=A0A9N9F0N2_9GLOM|nr:925_t:CDS:2 [Paraglomus occultum]